MSDSYLASGQKEQATAPLIALLLLAMSYFLRTASCRVAA
jgi:hypothetical protein